MKLVFSVFDSAAEFFSNPIILRSKGEAIRQFQQAVTDDRTAIHQAPADYQLFYIGTFNDETGVLTEERFECLARGDEMLRLLNEEARQEASQ